MLVLSVWVSPQCVGGWVPIKWWNGLITDWRQASFLSSNSSQTEEEELKQMQKSPSVNAALLPPEAANDRSTIYMSFAY